MLLVVKLLVGQASRRHRKLSVLFWDRLMKRVRSKAGAKAGRVSVERERAGERPYVIDL